MNGVPSTWDAGHSHLQTGHEAGGHLAVCEAEETSSKAYEQHDLGCLEEHTEESKSDAG